MPQYDIIQWQNRNHEVRYLIIHEKLTRPITEVNYLRAENVQRYRVIIRYFYEEHEKINYWLHKEDVYAKLIETGLFPDYTPESCQSDLDQLSAWKNLTAMQDTTKVNSLEEFKNRKYRYQLGDYTVEIERMTLRLENLEIEGASLEPTLLERIHANILKIEEIVHQESDYVSSWWNDLNNDFIRLNRNYQDYIRTLNSAKAEEMMKTSEFLIFKDKIIQYLRNFVKGLQEQALVLEQYIKNIDQQLLQDIFEIVTEYECSVPRIDRTLNKHEVYENCVGRWNSIFNWFVGGERESEVNRMSDITNDIIRRITRYAQQIGEMHNLGANRKEEYRHLAHIFSMCESINEAHILSAMVFGVDSPLHLKNLRTRDTDSIDSGVYQENVTYYDLEPRTRIARVKSTRKPAVDYNLEIQTQKMEQLNKIARDRKLLESYIVDNTIDFAHLPKISAYARKILLTWLSRALANKDLRARCEWGRYYHVNKENKNICKLECEDGDFYMPSFKIQFEEDI